MYRWRSMRNIKYLITTLSENDFCVFKLCFLFSRRNLHSTCGWISLSLLTNRIYFPLLRHVGVGLHFLGSTKLHMAIRLAFVNEMEGTGYFWWKPLNSNVHLAILSFHIRVPSNVPYGGKVSLAHRMRTMFSTSLSVHIDLKWIQFVSKK